MVSSAAILSSVVAFAACAVSVHGHGYMEIPLSEFVDTKTSEWIVQIDPQWEGDWVGDDAHKVEVYTTLAAERNVDNIRSFLDSDTSLYGADCGYTDPNAEPKDIPTTSTATLSRGIVHAGPCEIWLDDQMVMYNDDCQAAYSPNEDQDVKSVFPVDYSSCSSSGCMFRFYWLALQSLDGQVYWQVYKNCVPLKGGEGAAATPAASTAESTEASADADAEETTEAPSAETEETETPEAETEAPETEETEAPETEETEATETEETEAPETEETEAPEAETETEAPETEETEAPETEETEAPEAETPVKCSIRRRV